MRDKFKVLPSEDDRDEEVIRRSRIRDGSAPPGEDPDSPRPEIPFFPNKGNPRFLKSEKVKTLKISCTFPLVGSFGPTYKRQESHTHL